MTEIGYLTPGVEFDFDTIVSSGWRSNLVIRGVTYRHGTTTGVYIDDTPVPPARGETFGRSFPWAFDLDRIEVLRGPQGTLLGQGTLGGAIRFITNQPSLTTFTGIVRAELSTTAQGDGSYEAGVAAGGPVVTNVLGVRVSAWSRTDGGYVDRVNPLTGATVDSNANRQSAKSVRAALTWVPRGSLRVTPSIEYQSFRLRDTPVFDRTLSNPKAGDLRGSLPTQEPFNDAFYLASIKLNAGFSVADLSAVSSYFNRTAALATDWSPSAADPATWAVDLKQTVFSQEARLASIDPNAALSWIVGAFYSSSRRREADGAVQAVGLSISENTTVIRQTQLEGFGQLGLRMTKRLTARAGLRVGRTSYDSVTEAPPIVHRGHEQVVVIRKREGVRVGPIGGRRAGESGTQARCEGGRGGYDDNIGGRVSRKCRHQSVGRAWL